MGLTSVTDLLTLMSTVLYRLKQTVDGMLIVIKLSAMALVAMDQMHGRVPILTAVCMLRIHPEHWMRSHAEVLRVIRGGLL